MSVVVVVSFLASLVVVRDFPSLPLLALGVISDSAYVLGDCYFVAGRGFILPLLVC